MNFGLFVPAIISICLGLLLTVLGGMIMQRKKSSGTFIESKNSKLTSVFSKDAHISKPQNAKMPTLYSRGVSLNEVIAGIALFVGIFCMVLGLLDFLFILIFQSGVFNYFSSLI